MKRHSVVCLAALVCCFCQTQADDSNLGNDTKIDLALAVFKRQYLNRVVIVQGKCPPDWRFFRNMMTQIQTSIVTPTTLWRLDYMFSRTGILVDVHACPEVTDIFQQGAVQSYVNSTYRWLVLSKTSLQETSHLFRHLVLRLDTSITTAVPFRDSYVLADLHQSSDTILAHQVGRFHRHRLSDWVDAENAPFRSRINRTLETGALVLNLSSWEPTDTMDRFNLPRGHPRVPATYFAMGEYHVYLALSELYNISMKAHLYAQSGYPDDHGVFSGILGALQTENILVAATRVLMTPQRMVAVDFLNMCDPFSLGVIYHVSQSLDTPAALFKPFVPTLWISMVAAGVLLILALWHVGHWEIRSDNMEAEWTPSSAVLVILGIFAGQGHHMELRWCSTRTVMIVALLTGYLMVSAYSALIVRFLLNAPAPNIRTRADYMRSSLKMAVEDYYHFPKAVFNADMDEVTRELYEKKVAPPKGGGFRQVTDAFDGMLANRWAMFAQVNNIQLEMAKATPAQVCRLAWIHELYHQGAVCPILAKKSELKNLLNRGFSLAQERGLRNREKRRHHATQILCMPEHKRQWTPVKIQIVVSAVGMVLAGVAVGILLCIAERFTAPRRLITSKIKSLSGR